MASRNENSFFLESTSFNQDDIDCIIQTQQDFKANSDQKSPKSPTLKTIVKRGRKPKIKEGMLSTPLDLVARPQKLIFSPEHVNFLSDTKLKLVNIKKERLHLVLDMQNKEENPLTKKSLGVFYKKLKCTDTYSEILRQFCAAFPLHALNTSKCPISYKKLKICILFSFKESIF